MSLTQSCISDYTAYFACKINTLSDKYLTALNTGSNCAQTYLFQLQLATTLNEILCSLQAGTLVFSISENTDLNGAVDNNRFQAIELNGTIYTPGSPINLVYNDGSDQVIEDYLNGLGFGDIFTVTIGQYPATPTPPSKYYLTIESTCTELLDPDLSNSIFLKIAGSNINPAFDTETCVTGNGCLDEDQICEIIDKLKYILNNACNCGCS